MEEFDTLESVELYEEFRECPSCGYDLGFKTSFLRKDEIYTIVLICPNCGAHFEVGWT
ncbi:hypothetical protein [Methanobacterium alcaliphilum]|uniref:hypothetical protein n=1 Tax=Methanobacterium alcaliphilum TaxID=392018 RepID=UPI00200B6436|nr:hypothetical protein [Methanobacterium alcaliphilum]MCK9151686.1 hypothetical protein [Methanobacterium alcaliphilum]